MFLWFVHVTGDGLSRGRVERSLPVAGKSEVTKGCHQYRRDDGAEQMAASRGVPWWTAIIRLVARKGEDEA